MAKVSVFPTKSSSRRLTTDEDFFLLFLFNFAGTPQFESNGVITARYSNGQFKSAGSTMARRGFAGVPTRHGWPAACTGQVEIATFRNPQGLQAQGGNTWGRTFASGDPIVGTPGEGNLGSLLSGALEASNVDLTAELVNMITAQRTYQANAQTIKTQDQVLQTLVNLR